MRVKINKNVWFRENSILKGFNFINRIGHHGYWKTYARLAQ